jgi:hypothetical protein
MKSIESQLGRLERQAERVAAPEQPIIVDLVCATTREEALALLGLPETPPPTAAKVRLTTRHIDAQTYLNQLGGPTLPDTQE